MHCRDVDHSYNLDITSHTKSQGLFQVKMESIIYDHLQDLEHLLLQTIETNIVL